MPLDIKNLLLELDAIEKSFGVRLPQEMAKSGPVDPEFHKKQPEGLTRGQIEAKEAKTTRWVGAPRTRTRYRRERE